MKLHKLILSFILVSFITLSVFAQKDITRDADAAFSAGEFFKAKDLYKSAYVKVKEKAKKAEIVFKIAQCYKSMGESKQSEVWFKKAVRVNYPDPVALLYFADALKTNEKYDEAVIEYKKYKKLVPDDPRGKIGVESCELSAKWKEKPTRYKVENMAFFNSKQADFCPVFAKKDYKIIYFTSARPGVSGEKINDATGTFFTDIFESKQDRKGKWSVPVPIPGETVNSEVDEGAATLNRKANTIFFTRCRIEKKKKLGCQLYMALKKGVVWGEPELIPMFGDSISIGHPALSSDELTLYFVVNNVSGGQGGLDIWKITRTKKTGAWGEPVNMGTEINTPGDEAFPYCHNDGSLYFSSDYHIGMGGWDIFNAKKDKAGKYKITNLKFPINSAADDFAIIFEGDAEKGYLTSNRKGGKGNDDIYRFILPPLAFNLRGVVVDEKTDESINGAKIKLIGSDGTSREEISEADGSFLFKLKANTDYVLVTSKENYLHGKGKETTKGLEINKDFNMEIRMAPIDKPIEMPNIFYDLGKWDLRPESMVALDDLVEILNDNSNITIELGSHTDFRNTDQYNFELSQKRAQSVVNYLIEKGIDSDRLTAKGYGESKSNTVSNKMAEQYPGFLQKDDVLTERFIKSLYTIEEQEAAHQINRRTEFRVLSTNYIPKPKTHVDTTPDKIKEPAVEKPIIALEIGKEEFEANETIQVKVSLYDGSKDKLLDKQVTVIFQDINKATSIEKTIQTNKITDIFLGEEIPDNCYWNIKAQYKNVEATGLFFIKEKPVEEEDDEYDDYDYDDDY